MPSFMGIIVFQVAPVRRLVRMLKAHSLAHASTAMTPRMTSGPMPNALNCVDEAYTNMPANTTNDPGKMGMMAKTKPRKIIK